MNFKIAGAMKHLWEEPVISGVNGSGTIFFSGCSLRCVYCQNYEISHGGKGLNVSEEQLVNLMLMLQDEGAHNINLVTPSHYAKVLPGVLQKAKAGLKIPVVYNSSGYESQDDLKNLNGLIDIYLPDFKYADNKAAYRYSGKEDYFEAAYAALKTMRAQQPDDKFEKGIMRRGVIVRHLILPDNIKNSMMVLDALAEIDKNLYVSLMSQYSPSANTVNFKELQRRITIDEYDAVCGCFFKAGLCNGFTQGLDSATGAYLPDFDLDKLKEILSRL